MEGEKEVVEVNKNKKERDRKEQCIFVQRNSAQLESMAERF